MQVHPVQALSKIGRPSTFISGQFAGRTLRAELHMLQNAAMGRKFANKDRRVLDPPPIVEIRLFEYKNYGTPMQTERMFLCDPSKLNLICHVDIFLISASGEAGYTSQNHTSGRDTHILARSQSMLEHTSSASTASEYVSRSLSSGPCSPTMPRNYVAPFSGYQYNSATELMPRSSQSLMAQPFSLAHAMSPGRTQASALRAGPGGQCAGDDKQVIAYYGDEPIHESSKCTRDIFGSTFVQCQCVDLGGREVLVFPFGVSDLSVRSEGVFIFRFRAFDTSSKVEGRSDHPILAECFSAPFKMYSTKDFPGLVPSTNLTNHVAMYGARVRKRTIERRRKKTDTVIPEQRIAPPSPLYTTAPASLGIACGETNWRVKL